MMGLVAVGIKIAVRYHPRTKPMKENPMLCHHRSKNRLAIGAVGLQLTDATALEIISPFPQGL